ncbi:zinc ribbon domain-containing protein [Blautia faecis]|uniref:zinc ribbon domain-containing protein n=1 Tax=Blautia faecis TaxID=871665 RepID=UPI001D01896E|nr:zinc ribbon domain-containing protein [Blautia faecis]MCB5483747.1 zinc ribbon domain-containing protein [Blautia faecis]
MDSEKIEKTGTDTEELTKEQKLAEIEKLKKTIFEAEGNLENLYSEIGKSVYQKYKEAPLPEVEEQLKSGQNLEAAIASCKTRIESLKERPKCPVCGAEVTDNMLYCYNCGEKLNSAPERKRKHIYCRHCGQQLETESAFCTACGKKVDM